MFRAGRRRDGRFHRGAKKPGGATITARPGKVVVDTVRELVYLRGPVMEERVPSPAGRPVITTVPLADEPRERSTVYDDDSARVALDAGEQLVSLRLAGGWNAFKRVRPQLLALGLKLGKPQALPGNWYVPVRGAPGLIRAALSLPDVKGFELTREAVSGNGAPPPRKGKPRPGRRRRRKGGASAPPAWWDNRHSMPTLSTHYLTW